METDPKNNKNNQLPKYKLNVLNHAQKTFGVCKPVKGFRRFGKEKIADTGSDPNRAYLDFINKSIIQPLSRPNVKIIDDTQKMVLKSEKWTVGCTKKCNHRELLPKLDTFQDYYFFNPNKADVSHYQSTFLSSDHVSVREPKIDKEAIKEIYMEQHNKNNLINLDEDILKNYNHQNDEF